MSLDSDGKLMPPLKDVGEIRKRLGIRYPTICAIYGESEEVIRGAQTMLRQALNEDWSNLLR